MNSIEQLQTWLENLVIAKPDHGVMRQVQKNLNLLCKTDGGLGKLEPLLVKLAGMQRTLNPRTKERAALVFAADHGVMAERVSRFRAPDSLHMVKGILLGRTAVGVLAQRAGIPLSCWDVGLRGEIARLPGAVHTLHRAKVTQGTRNIAVGPAMTGEQCAEALLAGCRAVRELPEGTKLVVLGEMGMGNTTIAAALSAVYFGLEPEQVVGAGAGNRNLVMKTDVVRRALKANPVHKNHPLDLLTALGGLEVSALAGACLQAAAQGFGIILDGFVTSVSALTACCFKPGVKEYLVASHLSPEPGHRRVVQALELAPLMELDLRVGEGAGALLVIPLLDQAVALLNGMASFTDLGIHPEK